MVAFKINRPTYAGVSPGMTPSVSSANPPRSPRRRVLISGMFHSLTSSHRVSVRNLSCTGASIECDAALKRGAEGVLATDQLDCLCRVIWSKGNIHGVRFDQPLHSNVVLELHRITQEQVQAAEKEATKDWFNHQAR